MRKIVTNSMFALLAIFSILLLADVNNAQPRKARGRVYTKADVGQVIKNLEERVDVFINQFDKSLDHSKLNGTKREDNVNESARRLESATDELRREFDRHDTWQENRNEVQKCLSAARDVNKTMRSRKLGAATETNWTAVRFELNTLAKIYNLSEIK
jgi:hypothetical protein